VECPEEVTVTQGELTFYNWHLRLKIITAILIDNVSVLCIVLKLIFGLWLRYLNWKQNTYFDTLDADGEEAEDKQLTWKPNESLASLTCSIDAGEEMLHHLIALLLTFVDIRPGTDSGKSQITERTD